MQLRPLILCLAVILLPVLTPAADARSSTLKLATFDIDATPKVGTMMAYDPVKKIGEVTLRCRGVVILGAGEPIVLCAVDWLGIGNGANDAFRQTIATAVGTTPDRVAVHTLHQHDAPASDFSAEKLLNDHKAALGRYDGDVARGVLKRLQEVLPPAIKAAQPVTHLGLGKATVKQVASNRRILGPDGKVRATRYTATKDPKLRAEPEGVIDPELCLITFWNGDKPIASLSYYAVHPQSYYRTGIPNPDFPGLARLIRQHEVPAALHVHFNGAGGNLGAGKYNDGSHENRWILAQRVAAGMREAWEATKKEPISAADIKWTTTQVSLPPSKNLKRAELEAAVAGPDGGILLGAAAKLAWLNRCEAGHPITIGCLQLGNARVLHMPGELFVEYQLAAKKMRPDLFVTMAAYGDYGPGYIGTAIAYDQGGYETSARASNVAPEVEKVLLDAIQTLLK